MDMDIDYYNLCYRLLKELKADRVAVPENYSTEYHDGIVFCLDTLSSLYGGNLGKKYEEIVKSLV